jgi:hypothetical protein
MKQEMNAAKVMGAVVFACGLLMPAGLVVLADDHAEARFRGTGKADPVRIGNVTCKPSGSKGAAVIAFDIAWNHSWRATWEVGEEQHGGKGTLSVENWDAAWVFIKLRKPGADHWTQATLSTNRAHHTAPAGATLDVGLSDDSGAAARQSLPDQPPQVQEDTRLDALPDPRDPQPGGKAQHGVQQPVGDATHKEDGQRPYAGGQPRADSGQRAQQGEIACQ